MIELLSDGFRITAIFLLLLSGAILAFYENRSYRKNAVLFFFLCTLSYLLGYWELIHWPTAIFQLVFFFSVLFPISLWLLSKALFDDEFQWNRPFLIQVAVAGLIIYVLYRLNITITIFPQLNNKRAESAYTSYRAAQY